MGIGNIFHAFQPKDKIFFVLFEKVTENLVAMSEEFNTESRISILMTIQC
jgi:hypothetical protein